MSRGVPVPKGAAEKLSRHQRKLFQLSIRRIAMSKAQKGNKENKKPKADKTQTKANVGMFCRMKRPKPSREAVCRCSGPRFPSETRPSPRNRRGDSINQPRELCVRLRRDWKPRMSSVSSKAALDITGCMK